MMNAHTTSVSNYHDLMDRYKDVSIAESIKGVLKWDIETRNIPKLGLDHRSEQLGYLTKQTQKFWNSEKTGELLRSVGYDKLEGTQQRIVDLIQREYDVQSQIHEEIVVERAKQAFKTREIWKKAKSKVDFEIVRPAMEDLFSANFNYAKDLADIKDMNSPLDALVDERDEGVDTSTIGKLFTEMKGFLIDFIKKNSIDLDRKLSTLYNIRLQRDEEELLAREIASYYNYVTEGERAKGSIDEVEHPLTITCGPSDVRVTVQYGDFIKVINSMHHELGHAVHKLGKDPMWDYTPINDFGGPVVGEGISRYTENKIGKSYEFYYNFYPNLNDISVFRLNDYSIDEFYQVLTHINPGCNRIKADEVTYGLHIIIRFELEQLLFNDQLTVPELPQAWNEKYEKYLGVEVPNDCLGIMQDLHWFSVYYGYFHGYLMGDLVSSQFHDAMSRDLENWSEGLLTGDLSDVLGWHTENIYSKGALYPPLELVKRVTGSNLDTKFFKSYITKKYKEYT